MYYVYRAGACLLALLMGLGIGSLPSGAQAITGHPGTVQNCREGNLDEAYHNSSGPVWGETNWDTNECGQRIRAFIKWATPTQTGANHGSWEFIVGVYSRATASNPQAALTGFWLELRNAHGSTTKCYRIFPSRISWFSCQSGNP